MLLPLLSVLYHQVLKQDFGTLGILSLEQHTAPNHTNTKTVPYLHLSQVLWFYLNLQQKNHAVTLSLLPLPAWDGEENQKEKGKNWWVGMRTV